MGFGEIRVALLLMGHIVVESVRLGGFLFEAFGLKKNLFDNRGLLGGQIVRCGRLFQVVS